MKRIILTLLAIMTCLGVFAQQKMHKATFWGAKSDGETDNTSTIQRDIDQISAEGGGTLGFYVGRYVTGSFVLKSNVSIKLGNGAVLVAAPDIYAYRGRKALITAEEGAENISIIGPGVIEGSKEGLLESLESQIKKGYLPEETAVPALVDLSGATNVEVSRVKFWQPAAEWLVGCEGSENVVFIDDTCITAEGKKVKIVK